MRLIENPNLVVQWRFPRTRKRRIRKKWAKDPRNFKPDLDTVFHMKSHRTFFGELISETIVAHPVVIHELKRKLEWGASLGIDRISKRLEQGPKLAPNFPGPSSTITSDMLKDLSEQMTESMRLPEIARPLKTKTAIEFRYRKNKDHEIY